MVESRVEIHFKNRVNSTKTPGYFPKTLKIPFTGPISILPVFFVEINVEEFDIYEFTCMQ